MLKGWLLKTTGELLDGHSLVFLCRKATAAGAPLKGKLRDCAYVKSVLHWNPLSIWLLYTCVRRGSTGLHGCCKEIDGAVGITLRLLFDYYRKKPRESCAARLPRFFFKMPKICAIMIKPLRRSGFRLDGLITPTPKAAGSNPVGYTRRPLHSGYFKRNA